MLYNFQAILSNCLSDHTLSLFFGIALRFTKELKNEDSKEKYEDSLFSIYSVMEELLFPIIISKHFKKILEICKFFIFGSSSFLAANIIVGFQNLRCLQKKCNETLLRIKRGQTEKKFHEKVNEEELKKFFATIIKNNLIFAPDPEAINFFEKVDPIKDISPDFKVAPENLGVKVDENLRKSLAPLQIKHFMPFTPIQNMGNSIEIISLK